MNKLKHLLMAMFAIIATTALTACSDDKDSEKSLQGLWQNESFIYYFGANGKGYTQYAPTNGAYEVSPGKNYFNWYATDEILSLTYDSNSNIIGSPSYYYEVSDDILVLINVNYGDVSTYRRQ